MKRVGREGFTLIELLVVIAIIAILAAIMFPVFTMSKQTAAKSQCSGNMKQLCSAFQLYVNDWGGWYPRGGWHTAADDFSYDWQNVVYKYLKSSKILRCPSTTSKDMDLNNPLDGGSTGTRTPVSYLMNQALGGDPRQLSLGVKPVNTADVMTPSRCILLMEGQRPTDSQFNGVDALGRPRTLLLQEFTFYQQGEAVHGGYKHNFDLPRHQQDGSNVSFSDGHVRFYRFRDSRTLEAALPWAKHVPFYRAGSTEKWR